MNLIDLFNQKNINIYVKPANNRHMNPETPFNISDVNFTWSPQTFDGRHLTIDANFSNPTAISPLLTQDVLLFHFKENISEFIYSPELD